MDFDFGVVFLIFIGIFFVLGGAALGITAAVEYGFLQTVKNEIIKNVHTIGNIPNNNWFSINSRGLSVNPEYDSEQIIELLRDVSTVEIDADKVKVELIQNDEDSEYDAIYFVTNVLFGLNETIDCSTL